MHPLVRRLYKEALHVGRDYPVGIEKVRKEWKKAIRNPKNCPSCYETISSPRIDKIRGKHNCMPCKESKERMTTRVVPIDISSEKHLNKECEKELRKAVGKGRYMIREMIGVIQLKKYRTLKQRYSNNDDGHVEMLRKILNNIGDVELENFSEYEDDQKGADHTNGT